jgi:hypothetical protein
MIRYRRHATVVAFAVGDAMTAQHLFTVLFNAGIAISIGATVAPLGMSFTVPDLLGMTERLCTLSRARSTR